jgi:phosphinothricin acetyltransferase
VKIRLAGAGDLASIVEIYNHYVVNTTVTLDETPQTIDDRRPWFEAFGASGRYRLVVAADDDVCGWSCSTRYRDHPAFLKTVEFSICLAPTHLRRGLGTLLYRRLLVELEREDVHRAVVGIALPNEASVQLHRRMGFNEVGVFDEYATKGDRYISSLWMQRQL